MVVLLNIQNKCYCIDKNSIIKQEILKKVSQLSFDLNQIYFTNNDGIIYVCLKLRGGKGGFGAKLKTQGGKKVKPNDNMFSRDMMGRRISHAMIEKQFRDFCKKKIDEDQKVKKQKQQFKIMENTLKQQHAFMKLDKTYNLELSQTQKNLCQSIKMGRQKYFAKLMKDKLEKVSIIKQEQEQKKQEIIQKEEKNNQEDILENGKRIKPEQQKYDQISKLELKSEPIKKIKTQSLISAKDKLKNLFKK